MKPTAPTGPTTTTASTPRVTVDQIVQYGQTAADIYNTVKNGGQQTQAPVILVDPNAPKPQPNYTRIALYVAAVVGGMVYAMKSTKKGLKGLGCPEKPAESSMLNGPKKRKKRKK